MLSRLLLVVVCALASACSSVPRQGLGTMPLSQSAWDEAAPATPHQQITRSLFEQYQEWRGTHYAWGGMSRSGIDCSGYVYLTFKEQFDVELPRSTTGQLQRGFPVPRQQLRTGDLVFFMTGKATRHVGIYLNDDQFMHVSYKKGVMISDLREPYWNSRWLAARRIRPHLSELVVQR
ncbi:Hypothetical protein HDN1F_37890 [gamma proteobacterium HdN1]|nr:Hypothetical protein HDN1F_37890 [gamma proteobacterium HdN1]